ncbi:MAG: protein-tyrosine phosphatase family protein [Anaerolineae bacterium]
MHKRPLPDLSTYWVQPGTLAAGEYPASWSEMVTRDWLRRMLKVGLRVFIDLTEPGHNPPYEDTLIAEAAALGISARRLSFPIPDFDTPGRAAMQRILDAIDAAIAAGEPVYVHCRAGQGRTGTVVGCWLVRHGVRGEEAIDRIALLRGDGALSPETPAQRAMVITWQE